MIRPSRSDYLRSARQGHIVPVLKEIRADRITPIDALFALNGSYLLESAERGAFGRYSFLGCETILGLRIEGEACVVSEGGQSRSFVSSDPLLAIADLMRSHPYLGEGGFSPFPGGAVGYLGYDAARRWENLGDASAKRGLGLPDGMFMITRYTLVFDNLMHTLRIVSNSRLEGSPEEAWADSIAGIEAIEAALAASATGRAEQRSPPRTGPLKSNMERAAFEAAALKARELIEAGEASQVVLSQRFSAEFSGSAFEAYRALRSINPSPYMFYLDFGDFILFGASPEVMVRVEDRRAVMRPLAGTARRGADRAEDLAIEASLVADERERAEHLMLMDLARGELGRVAEAGSVRVDRMMEVERFSHVMHLVSEVSCDLAPGLDQYDVIRSVFPAGSVSGLPKIRAMEIIDRLEADRRGPYGGLIGYFSYAGGFDSCIAIRSALVKDGMIHIQSGSGILGDSDPAAEYEESLDKAAALFAALGSEAPRQSPGIRPTGSSGGIR